MAFQNIFQTEMLILREHARKVGERNPALDHLFNTPGGDPGVERLFENFSFLTAKLRQKLDDELPEITHGLFSTLWSNYLRPLPAASIIQYEPTSNTTSVTTIPRGTLVESIPIDGTRCQFQTIYDVDLLPLRVVEQRILERNGTGIIAVRFALTGGNLQTLHLSRLRVFFTGETTIPHTLYMTLTHRLKELRFVIKDGGHDGEYRENITGVLPPSCITPLGFREDEGMLPYPETTELGYRILQEYFCYPEKFLSVQIANLHECLSQRTRQQFQDAGEFELHFVLDHLPENYERFHAKHWNLHCTPIINIFPFSTRSQQLTQGTHGHKVVPDDQRPNHYSVYSVEQVDTWLAKGKQGEEHDDALRDSAPYRLHIAPTIDDKHVDTYIQIDDAAQPNLFFKLRLLCTNRELPDQLRAGDIRMAAGTVEATATPFKNIFPVSRSAPPPCNDDTLWKLLSNMSLSSIALTDVPAFQSMIATYAFRAPHDHNQARLLEKRLRSIRAIRCGETDRLFNGIPRRGAQTKITLDQSCFACEGDMYLFGAVLNEFLSMYATVNSFHQLLITEASRGGEYRWPARLGSLVR